MRCPVAPLPLIVTLVGVCALPALALAQSPEDNVPAGMLAPPVYAAHVDGPVTVTRSAASLALDNNAPLVDGDRVRTGPTSRVELATPEWGHVFLDQDTTLDLPRADRLRLLGGRARLDLSEAGRDVLRVETPAAGILPAEAGGYLIEVVQGEGGDEVTLTVLDGSAEFQTDRGSLTVRAGESARVRGMGASELGRAPASGAEDAFTSYVDQRLAEYRAAADAPETLPDELAQYSATLSRNGQWEYDASYGDVWYPAVAADWQPYGDGRWRRPKSS